MSPPCFESGAVRNRAIVVLESNTGYTQLHRMLVEAGDRSKVCTLPFAWLVAPGRLSSGTRLAAAAMVGLD